MHAICASFRDDAKPASVRHLVRWAHVAPPVGMVLLLMLLISLRFFSPFACRDLQICISDHKQSPLPVLGCHGTKGDFERSHGLHHQCRFRVRGGGRRQSRPSFPAMQNGRAPCVRRVVRFLRRLCNLRARCTCGWLVPGWLLNLCNHRRIHERTVALCLASRQCIRCTHTHRRAHTHTRTHTHAHTHTIKRGKQAAVKKLQRGGSGRTGNHCYCKGQDRVDTCDALRSFDHFDQLDPQRRSTCLHSLPTTSTACDAKECDGRPVHAFPHAAAPAAICDGGIFVHCQYKWMEFGAAKLRHVINANCSQQLSGCAPAASPTPPSPPSPSPPQSGRRDSRWVR